MSQSSGSRRSKHAKQDHSECSIAEISHWPTHRQSRTSNIVFENQLFIRSCLTRVRELAYPTRHPCLCASTVFPALAGGTFSCIAHSLIGQIFPERGGLKLLGTAEAYRQWLARFGNIAEQLSWKVYAGGSTK